MKSAERWLKSFWNSCLLILLVACSCFLIAWQFLFTGIILLSLSALFLLARAARFIRQRLPRKKLITVLCTLDLEAYSFLRCFYARFFSKIPPKAEGHIPILFLHGMLGTGENGFYLLRQLEQFGTVYTFDMGTDNQVAYKVSYEQEIERCALLAIEKIEEIFEETGKKQIILIGHSRGGVIANYLATTMLEKQIPLVITLGTPLQHPNRDDQVACFLDRLNDRLANNTTTRFLDLWAEEDVVTKKECSYPKEGQQRKRVKIKEMGHLSLLFSEEAVETIIESLSSSKYA